MFAPLQGEFSLSRANQHDDFLRSEPTHRVLAVFSHPKHLHGAEFFGKLPDVPPAYAQKQAKLIAEDATGLFAQGAAERVAFGEKMFQLGLLGIGAGKLSAGVGHD